MIAGASYIEIDVICCSDKQIYINHDCIFEGDIPANPLLLETVLECINGYPLLIELKGQTLIVS